MLLDLKQLHNNCRNRSNREFRLYQVDPSGTFYRGAGLAIGQYSDIALDVIQKEYSTDMSMEQAIQLSNKAIERALGERPLVETGVVTAKDGSFRKMANSISHFLLFIMIRFRNNI